MILDNIIVYDLESRKTNNTNNYLFIFPNRQILEWYKRYLQRKDIIYITEREIQNNGLVGLRYREWCFIDERMTKSIINKRFPIMEVK